MKTLVITSTIALLSLSTTAASAYPYYGHRPHHLSMRHHGGGAPGSHIISSGDRHSTATGGPVGGYKTQP